MDNYVRQGAELAIQVYDMMAKNEEVEMYDGTVYCPTFEGIPEACLVHGLFAPVRTQKPYGIMEYHNYVELVDPSFLDDPEYENLVYRNEPAYLWFAENGEAVLKILVERRSKALLCLEVPSETKKKFEDAAAKEGAELNDFVLCKLEGML